MDISTIQPITYLALLAGIVIGVVLMWLLAPGKKQQQQLGDTIESNKKEMASYKENVTEHFTETATLLAGLAESYKQVHNHLAKGAVELCDDEQLANLAMLQNSPNDDSNTVDAEATVIDEELPSPPLDYAPKTDNGEHILDESYGLSKKEVADADDDTSSTQNSTTA